MLNEFFCGHHRPFFERNQDSPTKYKIKMYNQKNKILIFFLGQKILCSLGSNCIKYVQKSSLIEKVGNLYVSH